MLTGPRRSSACRRRRRTSRTTATRWSRCPRWPATSSAQAEDGGAYILTETSADQLLVDDGRVVGVRSGDKGRGKDGEPLGNFEPGSDVTARVTVLAEGCWGHLTGAAIKEFGLAENREPQVWELGVKEVWKVQKPLDRVIHTLGTWPLKLGPSSTAVRRHVDLPDEGREDRRRPGLDRVRGRPRLPRRDHLALTTCSSCSRPTRWSEGSSRAASASAWGAKALPGGGYWSMPKPSMPGAVLVGDAAGMVDTCRCSRESTTASSPGSWPRRRSTGA